MIDAKPDENHLPPIQLAAALVRGEPTWENLSQAAKFIRDAGSALAAETKRADETEIELAAWINLSDSQRLLVRGVRNKLAAAEQARDEAVREVERLRVEMAELIDCCQSLIRQPNNAGYECDAQEAIGRCAALLQPKEAGDG